MKQIDISSRKHPNTFALVDDVDYETLNAYKWYASTMSNGKIYVVRKIQDGGKQKTLSMHASVIGRVEGKEIDHRSGITLDNQRHNLRHCTRTENQRNRRTTLNNFSGYKGVCWSKCSKKWISRITHDGKLLHLGYFFCLVKAAKAYDKAASEFFGEFARLNFIKRR